MHATLLSEHFYDFFYFLSPQMDSSKCSLDILHSGSSHSSTEKLTKLAEHLTVTQIERDMLKDKISQLQKDGVIEVGNGSGLC